jgi:hypothetical protein
LLFRKKSGFFLKPARLPELMKSIRGNKSSCNKDKALSESYLALEVSLQVFSATSVEKFWEGLKNEGLFNLQFVCWGFYFFRAEHPPQKNAFSVLT